MRSVALQLSVGNVWTSVTSGAVSEVKTLLDRFEGPLDGGPGLRNKQGDFYSGLVPLVKERLDAEVIYSRSPPIAEIRQSNLPFRKHQRDAVQACIKNKRGVVSMPTGAGKTMTAAGIMQSIPCTWLYIVHRNSLVESAAKTFEDLLHEPCLVIDKNVEDLFHVSEVLGHDVQKPPFHRIICATFDVLASKSYDELKKSYITSVQGIIVDECHKIPSKTALGILTQTTNAYYRFGLSATPFMREDKKDIHTVALLGPQIYSVGPAELAERGELTLPKVVWIPVHQTTKQTWYHKAYDQLVVRSAARNVALLQKIQECAKPAIIFVKEIEHAKLLFNALVETKGVYGESTNYEFPQVVTLDGGANLKLRMAVIDAMKRGEIKILICTSIFSEGLDVPNLMSVFNCTGEMSWKEANQRMGRGTRVADGKNTFTLYDVNDSGCEWLTRHTEERYLAYHAAGYSVTAPTTMAAWRAVNESVREDPTEIVPDNRLKGFLAMLGVFTAILLPIFTLLYHFAYLKKK